MSGRSSTATIKGRIWCCPTTRTMVLRVSDNPWLAEQIGHDIVTASGATLLGADNKAGVAEIMAAAEYLMAHPEIPHGTIRIALHAGRRGRRRHEVLRRAAIRRRLRLHDGRRDAGRARDREFFRRRDHDHVPRVQHASGYAKGKMVNAIKVAADFISRLPDGELSPETTEGYRGLRASVRRCTRRLTAPRSNFSCAISAGRAQGKRGVARGAGRHNRAGLARRVARRQHRRVLPEHEGNPRCSSARGRPRARGHSPQRADRAGASRSAAEQMAAACHSWGCPRRISLPASTIFIRGSNGCRCRIWRRRLT